MKLGDIVFLITDKEQSERMVTAICQREYGNTYELSCGTVTTWHSLKEISTEVDILKKMQE